MNGFYISPLKPDEIFHYGIKRRSGRYPYGSGNRPFQSEEASFYRVGDMKPNKSGVLYVSSDKDDAYRYIKNLGPTTLGKILGIYSDKFNEIKITSPLKEATVDQTMDIVNDVLYKNDDLLKTFNDSIHSLLLLNENKVIKKEDIPNLDYKNRMNLATSVMAFFGDSNYSAEAKKFYDYFIEKGFDIIPDLYDRNTGTSKTASIILSPDNVKSIEEYVLTKDDVKNAKRYLKTIEKLIESEYV